jgi:Ca2+-binding EF-hand superfamily protein
MNFLSNFVGSDSSLGSAISIFRKFDRDGNGKITEEGKITIF